MLARLLPSVAVIVGLLGATAHAAPAETLVLVSPPAELDEAVRTSLAPWRVKILVIDIASGSPAELALTTGAGYVVWRDENELVLWDAGGGTGERREIPPALDDAGAAALALSIKTWMNLGAPPPPGDPVGVAAMVMDEPPPPVEPPLPPPSDVPSLRAVIPPPAPPAPPPPPRFRIDAASGIRANTGGHGRTELRVAIAGAARLGRFDAVLACELGPSHPASAEQGFGELSTLVFSAHARYPLHLSPSVVVAPGLGLVVQRGAFSGVDTMSRAFSSSAFSTGIDAAGLVEWRRGRFLAGLELGATGLPTGAEFKDRGVRMDTPAHIETRGLARIGFVLR